MRLTLRTLLAYLDGLLETQQSNELATKINDSEFATDLVYRTLAASRNPAVNTPKLYGRGVGADPNSVAEYLDNTLEESRIPEFERICLDSDMYLAEVKGCHSVLTVVLEKTAAVNPELRNRIIGLPDLVESVPQHTGEQVTSKPTQTSIATETVNVLMEDPQSETDIQQRESLVRPQADKVTSYIDNVEASITWKLLKSVSLVVIIALCVIRFNGPINHENALIGSLFKAPGDGATIVAMQNENETQQSNTRQVGDVTIKVDENGEAVSVLNNGDTKPVDELQELREQIAENTVVGDEPATSDEELKLPNDLGEPTFAGEGYAVASAVDTAEESAEPLPERVQTGEFLSDAQITLIKQQDKNEWTRLVTATPLFSGDRLICVPGFNSEFLLNENIHIRMITDSEVALVAPDSEGLPQMTIHSGKIVISNESEQQLALGLSLAGRTGLLELPGNGSEMLIDTQRFFEPGLRINQKNIVPVVRLHGRNKARWVDSIDGADAEEAPASGYGFYTLIGKQPTRYRIANRLPEWIKPEWISHSDKRVGETLGEVFVTQVGPVSEILQTQYESHRLLEVRGAMPTVILRAGDPTAMVEALGNSEFRSRWGGYVHSLSEIVLTGKEATGDVVRAAKALYGEDDAELIIRMLRGYSAIQLEGEDAIDLVQNLEHAQMAVRSVAIHSLKRITGKTQLYFAEADPARQSLKIRAWRDSLKAGEIKYKQLPSPEELLD